MSIGETFNIRYIYISRIVIVNMPTNRFIDNYFKFTQPVKCKYFLIKCF
jgi:hypothetical protein